MTSGTFCGLKLFGRKASRFETMKSAHLNRSMKMEKQRSQKDAQASSNVERQGSQKKLAQASSNVDRQGSQKKLPQGSPKMDRQASQKKLPQGSPKVDRQGSQKKLPQGSPKMEGPRTVDRPRGSAGSFILMMELKKKIFTFRDIIDLPTCDGSSSVNEMIMVTMKDLHKFYPEIIPSQKLSEIRGAPLDKVLIQFSEALKSVGDSWMMNQEWLDEDTYNMHINIDKSNSEKAVEIALATLNCMIKISKEQLEMMDEDDEGKDSPRSSSGSPKSFTGSYSDYNTSCCASPVTPTSVLPQFMGSPTSADLARLSFSSTLLRSLRVQAVGKLNPIDIKRLSFHMPPNAEILRSLSLKLDIEDGERETNSKSMNDKTNSEEDLMFEMDASSHHDVRKDATAEDCRANNAETPSTACERKDFLKRPPSLSNIRTASSCQLLRSTPMGVDEVAIPDPMLQQKEMRVKQFTAHPPPPPATSMPHPHVVACPEIPPPPPLPPPSGAVIREQLLLAPPPPPPPPLPPMTSGKVKSRALLPPPLPPPPPAPMKSGAVKKAPLHPPPPPPPAPMKSGAVKEEASLPPPPPPLPQTSRSAAPAAPPPPPLPMMSPTGAMTLPPPPPPPTPLGSRATPPPPPLPMMSSRGGMPPPPPMSQRNGFAPPPPPPGGARSLRPNKAQTKLRRSSQMGNLYRILKGKVEGGNPNAKSKRGRIGSAASSAGGKQGMADALAEITKRSAYFQQIEEDVQKHAKSITELKTEISTFQTKDMKELIKFHKHVESILEKLADETQVLARFEGFPQKKLEAIRMAAALYSKLNGMLTELQNWKIEPPLVQLLDKIERYFNKIKGDIDALDRTKDEELKKFQSQNVHFDFEILLQIKESMVDVSSNCMELALREKRGASAAITEDTGNKIKSKMVGAKMLWRAFQFAFRVYTFAGGQDDRADALTRELAHEIETVPPTQ